MCDIADDLPGPYNPKARVFWATVYKTFALCFATVVLSVSVTLVNCGQTAG